MIRLTEENLKELLDWSLNEVKVIVFVCDNNLFVGKINKSGFITAFSDIKTLTYESIGYLTLTLSRHKIYFLEELNLSWSSINLIKEYVYKNYPEYLL